jgi:segregation and condensation protein A
MPLLRAGGRGGPEEDPRAELVRRLQEYDCPSRRRDSTSCRARSVTPGAGAAFLIVAARALPEITPAARSRPGCGAAMFSHHHIQREPLSVRGRMSDIMAALRPDVFVEFSQLFQASEGRMGVAVTFVALLELMREGLVEIVQNGVYGPIHLRAADLRREDAALAGDPCLHRVGGALAYLGEGHVDPAHATSPE